MSNCEKTVYKVTTETRVVQDLQVDAESSDDARRAALDSGLAISVSEPEVKSISVVRVIAVR